MRYNKKAQFYLIAAIIIIIIIVGFFGVRNAINTGSERERIYDIRDELNLESVNVVAHGVYSQKNQDEMKDLFEDFTALYTDFAGQGKNLFFVFGDENTLVLRAIEEDVEGSVTVSIGQSQPGFLLINKKAEDLSCGETGVDVNAQLQCSASTITVITEDSEYNFELRPDQNFYFILTQEDEQGKQVVSG